jgi:hypothetical protein
MATGYAECTLLVVRMPKILSVDIDAYQDASVPADDLFEELGDDRDPPRVGGAAYAVAAHAMRGARRRCRAGPRVCAACGALLEG